MSEQVDFEQFSHLEIKIGTVKSAERIEGSEKLIKVLVDFGEFERQIVAGFGKTLNPEDLVGKQAPFLTNVKTAKLMGVESQGVFIAVDADRAVLLTPEDEVENGSRVR